MSINFHVRTNPVALIYKIALCINIKAAYIKCSAMHMYCNLHCVVVHGGGGLFSRAMVHILIACIHCTVW